MNNLHKPPFVNKREYQKQINGKVKIKFSEIDREEFAS